MHDSAHIRSSSSNDSIDFNKLKIVIRSNWYWIVLIFIAVNAAAYLYIRYTKNIYESESSLKLDIKKDATEMGIKNMVEEQNLNHLSGEIEIIQSKLFLNRVLDEVNFEASFFSVGHLLNEELYRNAPAIITYFSKNHGLYNTRITFRETSPDGFDLNPENQKAVSGLYNKLISLDGLDLILARNEKFQKSDEIGYFFMIRSRDVLLRDISKNLTAEPLNFNANTVRVSFRDYNPFKAQYVLNKIDTIYLQYSNEQKNLANKQKIDWVSRELSNIEKKMEDFENYFENFTLQNKTNNLDEDLKRTIEEMSRIDSQRYEYTRRINEIDNLIASLEAGKRIFTLGMRQSFPERLTQQLDALQELELQQEKLKLSYKEITFAYRQKEQDIAALRSKTRMQLDELRNRWINDLKGMNQRKIALENEFASIPDKNTEFSKNQRFYKLYEEFYLTLMQSKSEFEIAEAGSTPDFKILSPASLPDTPLSPKKYMVAGIGLVASLVTIVFFTGLCYLLNNRITNLYELEKIDMAPVLGAVPMSNYLNGHSLHILQHPKSMVSESIRTLRTNLDFFNHSNDRKTVAISSTVSGEGKSFIAMNLGAVMALSDKKVILVDLDMRKAKVNLPFKSHDSTKGVSTILIGKNTWQETVLPTPVKNFDYLPSGPHPPNPSELLLYGEFSELLADLKKHYDVIILDTPPVGLVTDGIMAMKRADVSLYVFRANYSKKEFLHNLQRIISINKFSNITTLLNAVTTPGKTYGYGYYEDNGKSITLKSLFK
ncbi:MAG: polysaccharide biosynthesis tyrosine autokinase [Cyclobacteriaceae bacterium]